jgi:hypothetical protein
MVLPGTASAFDLADSPIGAFASPTIGSDKADYAPGETVILTGDNWLPGEHVHIVVNDDVGQTWIRESDVNADSSGSIRDEFQLPDSFIARYAVAATGDASGTARTTFTDGNVKVASNGGRHFGFTSTVYAGSANCTGTAGPTTTGLADANGSNVGPGPGQSALIVANLNANSPNASSTFSNWTMPPNNKNEAVQLASGYSATDRTVCIVGFQDGSRDFVGNYTLDTTPPQVSSINRANANPTSTAGNVSWTVTFSESVTGVDSTDFALVSTGLAGTPAIATVTGSGATYTVGASTGTGSGTLKLNLHDNDSITDAAANKLGGTGTGVAGGGGAGNGSFESQAYTIDRTSPTIAATAVTLPDSNAYTANTWTNKSVRVTFTCTDSGGSGKATDTASGDTDVTAETTSSGTTVNSSGTCTDNAGNSAAGASFGPIKIDKTAPSITSLGPTSSPNGAGWYKTDVVNEFKATDSLSGVDSACETAFPDAVSDGRKQSRTTTGEGTAVKVSSSSCTDLAGNEAAAIDSGAFQIDQSAPTVAYTGAAPDANANGWRNVDVTATFTATDNLSGFAGPSSTKTGTSTTSGEGDDVKVGSPEFTDLAGNTAAADTAFSPKFKIDKTAPSITDLGPTTAANAAGWHKTDVVNRFQVSDSLSQPDAACEAAFDTVVTGGRTQLKTSSGEGTDIKVKSDDCTDQAGNKADGIDSAEFKVDQTKPTVVDLGPTTSPNGNGWYNADVTNEFQATDSLSGFAGPSSTKTDSATTTGEGTGVTVDSPAFTDLAGNTAAAGTAVSDAFKIDQTGPALTPVVTPNPVTLGGSATVASNATDPLSTLDPATDSCGSLNTSSVGTKSVTCTATDKAGNTSSETVSYSVQFGWNGFLQPINDTAHQTGLTQSRFKLGSTVPAKFVLRNAAGQAVQQATNPTFTRTVRLRACDANATPEPASTDVLPDGGASYAWDGGQYHYNWSTRGIKDVGVYRIYAKLADDTQHWVDVCLW